MSLIYAVPALFLVLLSTWLPRVNLQRFISPFSIYCNYDLTFGDQSDLDLSDIALKLKIQGDPEFYVPEQVYHMTISSNQDFDGFQINAVFSVGPNMTSGNMMSSLPFYGGSPYIHPGLQGSGNGPDKRFLCSQHVHAHFGDKPLHELTFMWIAPPKGTGCISFKATATRNMRILFNSLTILHLCEKGSVIDMSSLHEEGLILRDDFDSSKDFDSSIWSEHDGLEVSSQCGVIQQGHAAVACDDTGDRQLVTVPLNLTTASVLQFAIASGSCKSSPNGEQVGLLYGINSCSNWTEIETVFVPNTLKADIHIVHIPIKARRSNVCLKWEQRNDSDSDYFGGCWALDHVAVVNLANPPDVFEDNFDPMDPGDWLFFSGAKVQHQCLSDQNAMVFDSTDRVSKYVTTRDLNLQAGLSHKSILLQQDFEDKDSLSEWQVDGGGPGSECDMVHASYHMIFNAKQKPRRLCTPYMDLTVAGSLRFDFAFGGSECSKGVSESTKVYVYVEDQHGHTSSVSTLSPAQYKNAQTVSLPLAQESRMSDARVCWTQKSHDGADWEVWTLDNLLLLALLPTQPEYFAQFDLNLDCAEKHANLSVQLEYSTSHGYSWDPLYEGCSNLHCYAMLDSVSSSFSSEKFPRWRRVTLPLPLAALGKFTRFRWFELFGTNTSWALDNVYIGKCPQGCSNHGKCTQNGCVCDSGYVGSLCSRMEGALPTLLIEDFSNPDNMAGSFSSIQGATSLGYRCGIVATGKALLFDGEGVRKLETAHINMSEARYLQFSIRIGSASMVGECPPPDHTEELVLLHYTCDGGVTWHLLRELPATAYTQPMMISVPLPLESRGDMCKFRWWQPVHSGAGHDVWAVDDISITGNMYNTVDLGFQSKDELLQSVEVHLGQVEPPYCGREQVLSFTEPYQEGEFRYVMTGSMRIGPSYMLQFDLVMGCDYLFVPHLDNKVYLEYSTNHGMTWGLVRDGCWPPRMCEEYHTPTIYYPSEYQKWRRITLRLPPHTWSSSTRFRIRQPHWSFSDSWAIDNLYIGLQCPDMCHGQGYCQQAQCRCDEGYGGLSCKPVQMLPSTLKTDFSLMSQMHRDWLHVIGGELAGANQGCGTMLSGESLFFFQSGPRQLISIDLNTTNTEFVEFYIQLGGENDIQCSGIESREENVLVQYSTDGGVTWQLLKELQGPDYLKPSLVHIELPKSSRTESTEFRWWQPRHSGVNTDHWAMDQVQIGSYEHMTHLEDDFEIKDGPHLPEHDLWQVLTEPMYAPYCGSSDDTLMFASQMNDKIAMTKDLSLDAGDTIQFWINVGCSKSFSADTPVLFEYTLDSGMSWHLVEEPCYQANMCHNKFSQGSIYYSGPYGEWKLVVLMVTEKMASSRVNLRWWQRGGSMSSFALNDVYIGRPCPAMCHGHGVCVQGYCNCHDNFGGDECWPREEQPFGMVDRFEDTNLPSDLWDGIIGAYLGLGCGVIGSGNSLYFHGDGPREAKTVPINTTDIKLLQFTIRIGNSADKNGCGVPKDRMEGVIVDYSPDNGIHWNVLKMLDPGLFSDDPHVVSLNLPSDAKTDSTIIRWWQPLLLDRERAEWAVDDVIIAVNDTSKAGFQENFNPMKNEIWYMAMNAIPRITCQSQDNALEFSKNGEMRYAETWDYQVSPATFLQFYIAMGCSGTFSTLYSVMLEFSVDMGRSWQPVVEDCLPPKVDCAGYHLSSTMVSEAHTNWTRITLYLPPAAVSPATRFRWLQQSVTLRGNVWALDNIYLGDGCPWMCSGHGNCDKGVCVCDPGYFGIFCVPSISLPMRLQDDFESGLRHDLWPEIYGGEVTNICGILVYGHTLTFHKENLRMVISQEMDVSMAKSVQFHFQYGCEPRIREWPREHTVLLQYSTNGGIVWNLLEDLHSSNSPAKRYFHVLLPSAAQTNATKFRFWQPQHDGHMKAVWSLDNVFIGGTTVSPDSLMAIMDTEPHPDDWLFWPSGAIDHYCSLNYRGDTLLVNPLSMVFRNNPGEHSLTTRDINVNEMTIIQFELNVGCSSAVTRDHPVRLEYSVDHGRTWSLVVSPCTVDTVACVQGARPNPSIYYSGTTKYWQRILVSLRNLKICGTARFRWYQGFFASPRKSEDVPEWGIKNVYIGMQCEANCNGHGTCMYGMLCQCEDGFSGELCEKPRRSHQFLNDDFDESGVELHPHKWFMDSGAELTDKCGTLVDGNSLHFISHGVRVAVTTDMDLTTASIIQFYIRLGCSSKSPQLSALPVYLQYSKDGGIFWETLQQFFFGPESNQVEYVALEVPHKMRSKSTRVRWWQPAGEDGMYTEEWALDQVYIGGSTIGRMIIWDDLSKANADTWLMYPGASIEPACQSKTNTLHFSGEGKQRFAVTNDITVTEATYMQFYLSMGCGKKSQCYGVHLEFSMDYGKTWQLLEKECMPADVDCSTINRESVFMADVYSDWTRVTISLPYYTRAKATRFRLIQQPPLQPQDTWAITNFYIGDECKYSCSGHGQCVKGLCVCDKGWIGEDCSDPSSPLPTLLTDSFTAGFLPKWWTKINGGSASTECGVLSSGLALHFTGDCTRQLISVDLDLRHAIYIHFSFRFGCLSPPRHRNEGVILDYTADGGKSWKKIMELYYDLYRNGSYVMSDLPPESKKNGVRIRLWQPHHPGIGKSDWAIDNIIIGGRETNLPRIHDTFSDAAVEDIWLQQDNIIYSPYCGSTDSVTGSPKSKETATLMTADLSIDEGYIIQFDISVGCNASWDAPISPVHLEYSTDYGMKWSHLVEECLPYMPRCQGQATTPSVYYATPGWRRVTIFLEGQVVSKWTRFRWRQPLMLDPMEPYRQHWALDDVYIGPACDQLCHGHGHCVFPGCRCDPGYGGLLCEESKPSPTYLKDTFDRHRLDDSKWRLVQGGDVDKACMLIVEGTALHFSGMAQRQAVTVSLDLRNARFVQYYALIGGPDFSRKECGTPKARNESILLQYSTNAGTTWNLLHFLDYQNYWIQPRKDYIHLPQAARTKNTQIRWWQPQGDHHTVPQIGWTLENIFIGGNEINPSSMYEDFEGEEWLTTIEFIPGGSLETGVCSKRDHVLRFPREGRHKSVTTQQMIVQENYMLQFKLVIGCEEEVDLCAASDRGVLLQYNKDPVSDIWDVIYPRCMLNSHETNMECQPYSFTTGSVYSLDRFQQWQRVTLQLPPKVFSSQTRFRWIQADTNGDGPSWAVDDIYIGERCEAMCQGRGECLHGQCHCDIGYEGETCEPGRLPPRLSDGFEGGVSPSHWAVVDGGGLGMGCGPLAPWAHGKNLYFSGCGIRQAITTEIDASKATKVMFVLQIGSGLQTAQCNIDLSSGPGNGMVVLQYSINKGTTWHLVATHAPGEFLIPKKVGYNIPLEALRRGVQFRWWQPEHQGQGHDQWAIDDVEIITTRQDQMMRTSTRNGKQSSWGSPRRYRRL